MIRTTFFLLMGILLPFGGFAEEKHCSCNAMIVCENSLEMLDWDLKFISQAKHSVELSVCFTGGTVFTRLCEAVEDRIKKYPDLRAYFLAAPVLMESKDRALVKRMQDTYPNNFHIQFTDSIFVPLPEYFAVDNHLKVCIVDEHYYSIGGTNFDEYLCVEGTTVPTRRPGEGIARNTLPGGMRDQDVVGRGDMAKVLRELFYKNYALWEHFFTTNHFESDPENFKENNRYFPIPSCDKPFLDAFEASPVLRLVPHVRMVFSGPQHVPNKISKEYESLIRNAKREISIGNLYCCPVSYVLEAMEEAVSRGIKLEYITNGLWDGSPTYGNFIAWANRMSFVPLFYGRPFRLWDYWIAYSSPVGKTRIWEYRVGDVIYHKKVMVVDKHISVIGTYNLGKRSDLGDYEVILVIESEEVAADILKVLERDKTLSEEIKPIRALDWYFDPSLSYMGSVQRVFHGFL